MVSQFEAYSIPIIQTKLHRPIPQPGLVSRPRLIERLNEGSNLNQKLTLISAPAGSGKTTLAAEWCRQLEHPTTWLSLDQSDNDPVRFLNYLIAAFQKIDPEVCQRAQNVLQPPQPIKLEPLLTGIVNEIEQTFGPFSLLLDDYHVIETVEIHETVSFFLNHAPSHMHMVIISRSDPPLPIARLRGRGQLTEIHASDLRFKSEEIGKFLTEVMGFMLSDEHVVALEKRTEGWVMGLQLAALSLQRVEDKAGFINSFTGSQRFILDYLTEEVLKLQPAEIQTFLLQTSVLDRLSALLCDFVTERTDSQEILEWLETNNLFVVPLDGERQWYRYHHLFADLLRQRLRQTQPEKLSILHIRASEWFTHQGLHQEAINHSLVARDYQGAAQLIRTVAIAIMQQGKHTTVLRWIKALPEEFVQEHPYLSALYAWVLQPTGQLESSEAWLNVAENALDDLDYQEGEDVDTILGLIHSRRSYLAFQMGENDKGISYARQAMEQLPETAVSIRAQTAVHLGLGYRIQGQLQAALDTYNAILPITQRMGGNSIAVLCYLNLAELYTEIAQLHRAREIYEQALQFIELHTGRPDMPFCGYVYAGIGRILRQWNQLDDSYRFTTKGVALCRDWNAAEFLAFSCIDLAFVHQALGNDEQSRESLQEAIQIMDGFSPWGIKYATAHQVKLDLARGDMDTVERWIQANDLVIDGDFEFHREIEYLTLVRVFIAQKRFEQAYALGQKIYRFAQDIGKRQLELEGLILLALVFSVQGETDQALVHLEKALSIAEPEGYIRIFVDEGEPMETLLRLAQTKGISKSYVSELLSAFRESEKNSLPSIQLIDPLSVRELEVLRLITDGLSNREIAEKLVVAVSTIKTHVNHIYRKLNVNSRTQAIAKSQQLGLL